MKFRMLNVLAAAALAAFAGGARAQGDEASLEARLASDEAKVNADRERLVESQARLTDAQATEPQLKEQLNQATGQVGVLTASLELAMTRPPPARPITGRQRGSTPRWTTRRSAPSSASSSRASS